MGYELEDDKYRLSVEPDMMPTNPRVDWSNLGTMACFHSRYSLGDPEHSLSDLDNPWEGIKEVEEDEDIISLPLYLYDHSGLVMRTTPFRSHWDSGRVGIIYAEKGAEGLSDNKIEEVLRGEVDIYSAYLEGNVWCFTLYEKHKCEECEQVEEEMLDSCGGFFLVNYDEEEFFEQIESHLPEEAQYIVKELEYKSATRG